LRVRVTFVGLSVVFDFVENAKPLPRAKTKTICAEVGSGRK